MTSSSPFGDGTISLKLHPATHAPSVAAGLVALGQRAEEAGFDGVTLSEHHGSFPIYMGQPLLACNWILAATTSLWAAPCPTLLPVRNPVLAAEELAWTNERFPGRIALGIASGYFENDFRALGVPFDDRGTKFKAGISELLAALSTEGPLAGDPAIDAWAASPGRIVSAMNSKAAARRAAVHGLGILVPGHGATDVLRSRVDAYRDAGGPGPIVLSKRIWIGPPPDDAARQMHDLYRSVDAPSARTPGGPTLLSGSVEKIGSALVDDLAAIGATCLTVRAHLPNLDASVIADQVDRAGELLSWLAATPLVGRR